MKYKVIMDNLKQFLSCLNEKSSVEDVQKTFAKIAEILLNKSHIITNYGKYRIMEIEFYFYNPNHIDSVTIPRDEEAGMWWLHDWGVDITFKSDEKMNFYGGILIRSLFNENNSEFICGPRKCCWDLFYSSAIKPAETPYIIIDKNDADILGTTERFIPGEKKGIKENYRYFVQGIDTKALKGYKDSPWK